MCSERQTVAFRLKDTCRNGDRNCNANMQISNEIDDLFYYEINQDYITSDEQVDRDHQNEEKLMDWPPIQY